MYADLYYVNAVPYIVFEQAKQMTPNS